MKANMSSWMAISTESLVTLTSRLLMSNFATPYSVSGASISGISIYWRRGAASAVLEEPLILRLDTVYTRYNSAVRPHKKKATTRWCLSVRGGVRDRADS